jgi:hypothetical protein
MNAPATMATLLDIVEPVIAAMPDDPLKQWLWESFCEEEVHLHEIERCFRTLTVRKQPPESLKRFFQSWSKTNNSAASVSGLASRITLCGRKQEDVDRRLRHYQVCDELQRITDEDLGAYGGVLHADLFYRMATTLCGDDSWLSYDYCVSEATEFRDWMDQQRLREKNIALGLLATLIHEVYTHGEVELIHPLFDRWFRTLMGLPASHANKVLAWVTVHTGGTESGHFGHATRAVFDYCSLVGLPLSEAETANLFRGYLRRKAAVMNALLPMLQ